MVSEATQRPEVGWGDLEHNPATRLLRNPRYAGAFLYGRTRYQKRVDGGERLQRSPRQEWHTLILDAHPGYITWQDYEENLRRFRDNAQIGEWRFDEARFEKVRRCSKEFCPCLLGQPGPSPKGRRSMTWQMKRCPSHFARRWLERTGREA
jgi:Recombinase